jgi:hypothetical protein
VVRPRERSRERFKVGLKNIDAARVKGVKICMTLNDMKRSLLLRTCLGELQAPAREVKGREVLLAP